MPFNVFSKLSKGTGSLGEPVRQSSWEVFINRLPSCTFHTTGMPFPNYTSSPIEIAHYNSKVKIAGAVDYTDIALTIIDTIDPENAQELYDWFLQVYDPEGNVIGFASEYKDSGRIVQYDTKGSQIRQWNLEGVWPTSVNFGTGEMSSKEPVNIEATLSVDYAVIT